MWNLANAIKCPLSFCGSFNTVWKSGHYLCLVFDSATIFFPCEGGYLVWLLEECRLWVRCLTESLVQYQGLVPTVHLVPIHIDSNICCIPWDMMYLFMYVKLLGRLSWEPCRVQIGGKAFNEGSSVDEMYLYIYVSLQTWWTEQQCRSQQHVCVCVLLWERWQNTEIQQIIGPVEG